MSGRIQVPPKVATGDVNAQTAHRPSRRSNRDDPEHTAARHLEQGAREIRASVEGQSGWHASTVRRASAPSGSLHRSRYTSSNSARIRWSQTKRNCTRRPTGISTATKDSPKEAAKPRRHTGLRDRAEAGGRTGSASLYGAAGRRHRVGGGMRLPGRTGRKGPARIFPRWIAAVRGDRPAGDRRSWLGQPNLREGRCRICPNYAAWRLHQGARRGAPYRPWRRRHLAGAARFRLLRLQAGSPGGAPNPRRAGARDKSRCNRS